ncbi:hypothetical protein C1646_399282 [Rhizophagus diaphanus]|nr:hypothetical protein C1646_399282 [Rhizophagus diaphanus] [Rhizophagus sp. MUCL 43196]
MWIMVSISIFVFVLSSNSWINSSTIYRMVNNRLNECPLFHRSIARYGQTLQAQFPDKKFQILFPYENWKPGRVRRNQSLFILDHYDEAQLPPDGGDPDYFDRFIIYVRDNR